MSFDWDAIDPLSDGEMDIVVGLSGTSVQFISTAIQFMQSRWRWYNLGLDSWDEIEAKIANVWDEIMTNILIGTVQWTTGEIPSNGLPCDGRVLDPLDYPELYAMIDSAYKLDPYHFALPNIENRFIVGAGDSYSMKNTGGLDSVELTKDQTGRHKHSFSNYTYGVDIEGVGIPDPTGVGLPKVGGEDTSYTGSGDAHENRPPYIALVAFIFVK